MKRMFIRITAVAMLALAVASCSSSTTATAPTPGPTLERLAGTLVERNLDQMAYDGPMVLRIAPRPGHIEDAEIPGSLRGDITPKDLEVLHTANSLRIGSYVVALGTRAPNGVLVVKDLHGGF